MQVTGLATPPNNLGVADMACSVVVFCLDFLLHTLLSLSGNSGRLTWVRLQQPREQRYPALQVHAGSFRVSVIHRTLTWTPGCLTSVRDHSYACVYTRGLGTPSTSQHNIFDSEKLSNSCAPDGVRTSVLWISSPTLNLLSYPVTTDLSPVMHPVLLLLRLSP